jgi:hypothetical protein
MKEVLSLFTSGIGALCFLIFLAVFRPDAVCAVPGPTKPDYCNTEALPAHTLPPHVFAAGSWPDLGLIASEDHSLLKQESADHLTAPA